MYLGFGWNIKAHSAQTDWCILAVSHADTAKLDVSCTRPVTRSAACESCIRLFAVRQGAVVQHTLNANKLVLQLHKLQSSQGDMK